MAGKADGISKALGFKELVQLGDGEPGTLIGLDRHTAEISAYKSAIAIKPDYADAYINIGAALDNLGRHTEAIGAFRRAASLDPDGDTGELAREALQLLVER